MKRFLCCKKNTCKIFCFMQSFLHQYIPFAVLNISSTQIATFQTFPFNWDFTVCKTLRAKFLLPLTVLKCLFAHGLWVSLFKTHCTWVTLAHLQLVLLPEGVKQPGDVCKDLTFKVNGINSDSDCRCCLVIMSGPQLTYYHWCKTQTGRLANDVSRKISETKTVKNHTFMDLFI